MLHTNQYIAAYLRARRDLAPHSRANARTHLYRYSDTMGARPVRKIGRRDIQRWQTTLHGYAPATQRAALSTVRQFWRWLVDQGHASRNPALEVRGPRQPRRLPRALPNQNVGLLLAAAPDSRARLIITLMVQQGLRCVEVSRLTVGDVDLTHGTLRITGKGGHERLLPLLVETRSAILLVGLPSAGPLVVSERTGGALLPPSISRLVSEWCRAAGIKGGAGDGVSAHALRHTTATDMLRNGAHLRDVQAALGHKSIATTEVYLPMHVLPLAVAMAGRSYQFDGV